MTSTIRGVQGGGWSRNTRFRGKSKNNLTPGPVYSLASTFEEHKPGPIYRASNCAPAPTSVHELNRTLPHCNRDRTSWIIGVAKNDMIGYYDMAAKMGPAGYSPSMSLSKPQNPRPNFPKGGRFTSLTKQYISKDHNEANLCTAGPGPKYTSEVSQIDLVTDKSPHFSFRSKGVADRASFLNTSIHDGYIYQAKPATNDKLSNVSPSTYSPDESVIKNRAPRPQWGKAERFSVGSKKQYISKKHARVKVGRGSPGPMYSPKNYDMYQDSTAKRVVTVAGKWCP